MGTKKYKVTIGETNYFDVIIECGDMDDPETIAREKLAYKIDILCDKTECYQNLSIFGQNSEMIEIEEV